MCRTTDFLYGVFVNDHTFRCTRTAILKPGNYSYEMVMQKLLTSTALLLSLVSLINAQEDSYSPGTVRLTPQVELGLESAPLSVPEEFVGVVPEGLSLNLPPGFTVRIFAAGLEGPRFMAWSPDGVLHVANMKSGCFISHWPQSPKSIF